jgi:hypothetical protein
MKIKPKLHVFHEIFMPTRGITGLNRIAAKLLQKREKKIRDQNLYTTAGGE